MTSDQIIEKLNLKPLPHEGGYYRETYRANKDAVCSEFDGKEKRYSTSIYYLVTENNFSALHRVKQDEIFHFYSGSPVEMLQIFDDGSHKIITIGNNILNGEEPQVLAPKMVWQGTILKDKNPKSWALMGTTVAPAFEFVDFELWSREKLTAAFPHLKDLIAQYTHG